MTREQQIQELRDYVVTEILDGDGDELDESTPILELGIIDSLSMVGLLAFIDEKMGIQVPDTEVRPENFHSLGALADLLERLSGGGGRAQDMDGVLAALLPLGVRERAVTLPSGRELHLLETAGAGPRWIVLPPVGFPATALSDLLKVTANDQAASVVDLPGFGRTPCDAPLSFDDQCAVLEELLDADVKDTAAVVASSAAAAMALELATRRPRTVAALVLMGYGAPSDRSLAGALQDLAHRPGGALTRACYRAPSFRTPVQHALEGGLAGEAAMALLTGADRMLRRTSCPALLVFGEDDPFLREADVRRAAEALGNASVQRLPRCGHFPVVEAFEEVALLARGFLAELDRGDAA